MKNAKFIILVFAIATFFLGGWLLGHFIERNFQLAQAQGVGGIDIKDLHDKLNLTFVPINATDDTSQVKISEKDAIAIAQAQEEGRLKDATNVTAELGHLINPDRQK